MKNPTRKQKEILAARRLNPKNWLVKHNLLHQGLMHIVSKKNGRERVIQC